MSQKKLPAEVLEYFKKQGSKGGKKGGKSRMSTMTPEERADLAKKAASARWDKVREKAAEAAKPKKRGKQKPAEKGDG